MSEASTPNDGEQLSPQEAAFLDLMEELNAAVQSGDAEKTTALQAQFWSQLDSQMKQDPFLDLYAQAESQEWAGNWAEAERIYREAIRLAQETGKPSNLSRSFTKLSGLLLLLGRDSEAFEATKLGLEYAEKDNTFVRATTLPDVVSQAIRHGDLDLAKAGLEEMRELIPDLNDLRYANYLLHLAEWRLALDDLVGLEEQLETVRRIAEPQSRIPGLAGFHTAMARYWTFRSQLFKRGGNLRDAGAASWEAIQFRRSISQMPQLNGPYKFNGLALALRGYARLCREAGHEDAAKEAKSDSDEVRRLIHLPPLED